MEASSPAGLALLDEARLLRLYKKILRTERANLISFLPLRETSGAVATDLSGQGTHGAYVNVTLGQPGVDSFWPCPLFDGSTSYVNWHSAALAAAFNGGEGTLLSLAKVANAGVWTNGLANRTAFIGVDSNNYVGMAHYTNNSLYQEYHAGGVALAVGPVGPYSDVDWMALTLTWSESLDQLKAYKDGPQIGTTQTGLGTWAGTPQATLTCIGSLNTIPNDCWFGNLSMTALWSKALTPAQIAPFKV